jgi:hypothetical protein
MTDETQLPRFLVRRGAWRDWMVWDRQTKGPAKYQGHLFVGLTEDRARAIRDKLIKLDAKAIPPTDCVAPTHATSDGGVPMTTSVAKLLEQKRQLVERLEHDPGPEEREQIERVLEQVNAALDLLEDAGPRR